ATLCHRKRPFLSGLDSDSTTQFRPKTRPFSTPKCASPRFSGEKCGLARLGSRDLKVSWNSQQRITGVAPLCAGKIGAKGCEP
ncbi:MAG TPA: hypothetical protein VMV31_07565, partial [Terriglobales bacterium]|nr:hypothetical protein [Terriglobales bacterium]